MFFSNWRKKRKEKKAMLSEVMGFIRSEQRVNAIKAYRRHSGLGLKESKAAVDDLYSKI